MTKLFPVVLVLAFTCIFALSAALPSVNQVASLKTDADVPRTFLGKTYRRRRELKSCSRPCCTLVVADRNDSHANARADASADVSTDQRTEVTPCPLCMQTRDPGTLVDHDHTSAHEDLADSAGWTTTKTYAGPRVKPVLPVVNSVSESGSACSRLMRSKQVSRFRNDPSLGDGPLSSQVRSNRMALTEDGQRVQLLVVPKFRGKAESPQIVFAVGRWKRLYDRGEWKSRLLEEY